MIKHLKSEISYEPKKIRDFGLLFFVIFAIIVPVFLMYKRGWEVHPIPDFIWLGAGAFFLAMGLFLPMVLRPLYTIWMMIALVLGHIMTQVIIGIVFYLVMTPIGLIRRLSNRDPLQCAFDAEKPSYWIDKPKSSSKERLKKLY